MKKRIIFLRVVLVLLILPFLITACKDKKTAQPDSKPDKSTLSPKITSTTPSCFYNSTVTITGRNFNKDKEKDTVRFGKKIATVIDASETSLTVKTPNLGDATSSKITVKISDKVSNTTAIHIDFDQNKVATYDWPTDVTVRQGVEYREGKFKLFGDILRKIYVLDVTLNGTNQLGVGFTTDNAATVTMCKSYGAIVGINAGYFPFLGSSGKAPYIRIDGNTVQDGSTNVKPLFTNAALTIYNNVATVRKLTAGGRNLNRTAAAIPVDKAEDIIVCGPMLLTDGVLERLDMSEGHNNSQTGRTGFGVTDNGKQVIMVVVDTKGGVTGVTTPQLGKILQALGAENAMNFDGGGSSTMFVQGQGLNGLVNRPYGGTWQRPVRSVVYVK